MEKKVRNNAVRNFLVLFSTTLLMLVTMVPANASGKDEVTPVAPQATLKYAGTAFGRPVFQVNFQNPNKEVVDMSIEDSEGGLLFFERVKEDSYSKNFQFDIPYQENLKLVVTLATKNGREKQTFLINSNEKVERSVVVSKL
jgi:hypothetical protein